MPADDRPRYLARMSGYTTDPGAAVDKLEAVSKDEQQRQTSSHIDTPANAGGTRGAASAATGCRSRQRWGGCFGSDGLEAACTIRRTVDRLDRAANR